MNTYRIRHEESTNTYSFTITDIYGKVHTRGGFRTETIAIAEAISFSPYN